MSIYKGDKIVVGGEIDTYFVRKPVWSQAVSISAAAIVAGYMCPADGMIVGYFRSNSYNTTEMLLKVNNIVVSRGYDQGSGTGWDGNVQVVVNAGDKIIISGRTAAQLNQLYIRFVPFEDSTVDEPEVVTPESVRNMHDPDWANASDVIAPATLTSGYTAPKRGVMIIMSNSTSGYCYISVNGMNVGVVHYSILDSIRIPVNKGDVIKTSVALNADNNNSRFIPYKAQ